MPAITSFEKELWRRGILFWKLHVGQAVIEHAYAQSAGRSKLFVADCSRQLGKTTWAVSKAIEKAIQKPGARIRVGTAFLSDLEQFVMPAFDFILQDCPSDLSPKWNGQKMEFVFPTGSKLRLVGLDRKPNGLRGNKLDLVVLDEAGYIARLMYLYKYVLIPSTTHVPDAKIIMLSTQPQSPDHDFVKFCDRAQNQGCYVQLDVWKNPLLAKQQIDEIAEELGGFDSTAFRREYLCERIVEEELAIVPEFRPSIHVRESPRGPLHHFWYRLEALDSGVRDKTAALFAYYDFERAKLCIEDEFTIQGAQVTTRRINECTVEKEKALGYDKVYRRTADNDNLILIQDLGTEFGLWFTPTDKDSLQAMVNKVRMWFQRGKVEINPRCVGLIGALKAGIWTDKRDQFARSETHGHFDLIAALVYLVRNCPENDNPVPANWNVNISDTIILPSRKTVSEGALGLKQAFGG